MKSVYSCAQNDLNKRSVKTEPACCFETLVISCKSCVEDHNFTFYQLEGLIDLHKLYISVFCAVPSLIDFHKLYSFVFCAVPSHIIFISLRFVFTRICKIVKNDSFIMSVHPSV